MSSKNIQRGVRSQRGRGIGDAPDLGRVSRLGQPGMPNLHPGTGVRRRRRANGDGEGSGSRQGGVPWGLMALLIVAALGLLGGAFAFWLYPMLDRRKEMAANAAKVADARGGLMDLPEWNVPSEEEVRDLVKRALAVRNAGEVDAFFLRGGASAEEVVAFLAEMEKREGKISGYDSMRGMDANGLPLEGVLVNMDSGDKKRNRIALLTPDEKGRWKVDFPAFERRADPPWEDLREGRAASAVVRVYVARDYYYNGVFSDESEWRCYGVASPDVEDLMLGYCRRGSAQDRALAWILEERPTLARATLELGRVEGAESRQYEIQRVLAQDWVVGEVAFDEK